MRKWLAKTGLLLLLCVLVCHGAIARRAIVSPALMAAALSSCTHDSQRVQVLLSYKEDCSGTAQCLLYYREAVSLAKKAGLPEWATLGHEKIADIHYYCLHNYDSAIAIYTACAGDWHSRSASQDESRAYLGIADVYKQMNNSFKALEYYKKARALNQAKEQEVTILGDMGIVYKSVGDYNNAFNCYAQAIKILDQYISTLKTPTANDMLEMAGLYIVVGELQMEMQDYPKAIGYYNKALEIEQKNTNAYLRVFILKGLGTVYERMNELAKAGEKYQAALALCRETKDELTEAALLNSLAGIYLNTGQGNKALATAKDALKIAERKQNSTEVPFIYVSLARVYTQLKKYKAATGYLYGAIRISEKSGALDNLRDDWQALSTTYNAMKQPALALNAYKQYIRLRDSVFSQQKARDLTRLDMQSEFDRKQFADSMRAEKQERAALLKIQRQRSLLWAAVFFSVIVVAVVILVYVNNRRLNRLNIQVNNQKDALEKSNTDKERILHIVAHDLRNPVGFIAYMSDLMLMGGKAKSEILKSVEMIKNTSLTSLTLINELVGRESKELQLEVAPEDIGLVVDECAAMLGFMAAEKKQTIKVNLPPIPIYAYINRGQISRVVGNLLRNAIKFSYEGQCIEISVESEAGANVLIKVKDAGMGIPESKHRELFNIFTSSQSIGTGGEKPFGLGLYISRQIIEAHGGTITFESKENEGTTFYVRLQQQVG